MIEVSRKDYGCHGGKSRMLVSMLGAFRNAWNRAQKNHENGIRTWILVDETYPLMENLEAWKWISRIQRLMRIKSTVLCLATQASDFIFGQDNRSVLSNSSHVVMLVMNEETLKKGLRLMDVANDGLEYAVTERRDKNGLWFSKNGLSYF